MHVRFPSSVCFVRISEIRTPLRLFHHQVGEVLIARHVHELRLHIDDEAAEPLVELQLHVLEDDDDGLVVDGRVGGAPEDLLHAWSWTPPPVRGSRAR